MKKCRYTWIAICITLLLPACAVGQQGSTAEEPSQAPTWQEQYDLGVRYLSEGNYKEAVLAFTTAIEIDPKKAPAYVGRGDAYVKSGETEENLTAAKADYETAIELDETGAEAYLGLADVYLLQGDTEKAQEILRPGLEKTGSEAIRTMLDGIFVEETDANGKNAYGVTAFTLRDNYIPFSDLTAEEQRLIAQATTAAIQSDRDTLLSLSEAMVNSFQRFPSDARFNLYTTRNQCKIGVHVEIQDMDSEGTANDYYWYIEVRPQNDIGYYAQVNKSRIIDTSKITQTWYYEYINYTYIASCPCVDWQWNGPFNAQSLSEGLQHMDQEHWNGAICMGQRNDNIVGQMKDNFRDGVFSVEYTATDEFPNGEHESASSNGAWTESYSEGDFIGSSENSGTTKFANFNFLYTMSEVSYSPDYRKYEGEIFYW